MFERAGILPRTQASLMGFEVQTCGFFNFALSGDRAFEVAAVRQAA